MENYITVKLNGGSEYVENVAITYGEALLLDCKWNGAFQNKVWDELCNRIFWREGGMKIQGYFQLVSYTINGETKPSH